MIAPNNHLPFNRRQLAIDMPQDCGRNKVKSEERDGKDDEDRENKEKKDK